MGITESNFLAMEVDRHHLKEVVAILAQLQERMANPRVMKVVGVVKQVLSVARKPVQVFLCLEEVVHPMKVGVV
jgi:hypothetical protein